MPDIGSLLRRLREARGWSYRELAGRVPCSHVYLSEIERGRKKPSQEMAARLGEVLDAGGDLVSNPTPAGSAATADTPAAEAPAPVAARGQHPGGARLAGALDRAAAVRDVSVAGHDALACHRG